MNTNMNDISHYLNQMDRELLFLWQDANEETVETIQERKFKQYWELFRTYKKQKQFLIALAAG